VAVLGKTIVTGLLLAAILLVIAPGGGVRVIEVCGMESDGASLFFVISEAIKDVEARRETTVRQFAGLIVGVLVLVVLILLLLMLLLWLVQW
jgi:tetrahydromethanopterin S-methyltransferase subunit F